MYRVTLGLLFLVGLVAIAQPAAAHCSKQTLAAYAEKGARASDELTEWPRIAEHELRDIYRDLTYCAETTHDNTELWQIGILRELVQIEVGAAATNEGRFSDARTIVAAARAHLRALRRDAAGNAQMLTLIGGLEKNATMVDSIAHRAQGRISMKAAGDGLFIIVPTPRPHARPVPTAEAAPCAQPNVPPGVDSAVEPETPPIAQQQGIAGDVQVLVSLDASDQITRVAVQSSPSRFLDNAALAAARQSTFHTAIRNCRKIATDYLFVVTFTP